jgi:MoaA/NifB/PqqE/SkfB family radical SAM enzyme
VGYSVGIGLTNDCNLNCAHCYRDSERVSYLSLAQVMQVCDSIPVDAMGMGTGENALHPDFVPIVDYLRSRGIKLSIASNGYSLMTMSEATLRAFHDVEVSIDFPTQAAQDEFRGAGNWTLVHQAIERCKEVGTQVSILCTLMNANWDKMDAMVGLARQEGVNLRVNAYQPVKTDAFRLSYAQFWGGYRSLFAAGMLVSCAEPVVRAVLGLGETLSPCGRGSIRINPYGQVIPCVYWPVGGTGTPFVADLARLGERVTGEDAFRAATLDPPGAAGCPCGGGCASRRALNHGLDGHDEYCPWTRGEPFHLDWHPAPAKDLMRSGNVCTTVLV